MPLFTILFGVGLMVIGIIAYIVSEPSSIDSLLPSLLGLIALALGVGSVFRKELRKHLMHAAVIIAVMGVLVPVIRMLAYLAEMEYNEQVRMARVLLTMLASAAYVYAAVQSFRAVRKNRKEHNGGKDYKDSTPEQTEPQPSETEPPEAE